MRKEKGITLVALVLTIIVLIILATVAINMTFGEDGIITRAEQAAREQELASLQEEIQFANIEAITRMKTR